MERIEALSTGTKLTLASGSLLFLDLFFTWQNLPERFGKKFEVTASLDGWDRIGLVLGLSTLAVLTLAVIRETNAELSPDVPWNTIALTLAAVVLAVATLKNVTDAHSAWAAYAGVLLAALTVVGAYLDRDRPPPEAKQVEVGSWTPRVRAAARPEPSNGSRPRTTRAQRGASPAQSSPAQSSPAQPGPAQPTSRW